MEVRPLIERVSRSENFDELRPAVNGSSMAAKAIGHITVPQDTLSHGPMVGSGGLLRVGDCRSGRGRRRPARTVASAPVLCRSTRAASAPFRFPRFPGSQVSMPVSAGAPGPRSAFPRSGRLPAARRGPMGAGMAGPRVPRVGPLRWRGGAAGAGAGSTADPSVCSARRLALHRGVSPTSELAKSRDNRGP